MQDPPRVLIVGCGGVGIAYSYVLSRSIPSSHIYAVCRSNFQAATDNGFTLNSQLWGDGLKVRPVVVNSVDAAVSQNTAGFDYILVCAKCLPPFDRWPRMISPAVGAKTSIVLLQNGIGIEDPYAESFPGNPIVSVSVYIKATEVAPAVVEHNVIQHLHMGTFPADAGPEAKEATTRLAQVMKDGGATVTLHDNVQDQRWQKAIINTVWNPIAALTRLRDGEFLASDDEAQALAETLMRETAAVATACGAAGVDEELVQFQLGRNVARKPGGVAMSMLFDAEAGRAMEVEVIIGNVVALGRKHGVPTPSLATVYLLVKGLNASITRDK